jgi:hypothetical protein
VLLQDGQIARSEVEYQRALDSARRVRHTMVLLHAQAGVAALHRLHGRNEAAGEAATEALEIHRASGPRRFRNRIHPETDLQVAAAVCCTVLAVIAAEAGNPERAATLLKEAEGLRTESGTDVPAFQIEDVERATHLLSRA